MGVSPRAERYWHSGEDLPRDPKKLEQLFWGDLAAESERQAFWNAYNQSQDEMNGRKMMRGPKPQIRVFGTLSSNPAELPTEAWACYKDLFRDSRERDNPRKIRQWLGDAWYHKDEDWAELFFVMEIGTTCIGMAFVSIYRPRSWCFGNYFGILKSWRRHDRTELFINKIAESCERILPTIKGIIFEVERYDERVIETVFEKFKAGTFSDGKTRPTHREEYNILAASRLAIYMGKHVSVGLSPQADELGDRPARMPGALAVASLEDGVYRFVDYVQPAMEEPLTRKNEVDLWLMVYPLRGLSIAVKPGAEKELAAKDVDDLFEFIYGHVFLSAYFKEYMTEKSNAKTATDTYLENYGTYVARVRQEVQDKIGNKRVFLVRQNMLSEQAQDLIFDYHKEIEAKLGIAL